jgi:hypothetical protein
VTPDSARGVRATAGPDLESCSDGEVGVMVPNGASSRMVLVKGRAGLGNRMLSALTGLLYARLSGRRLLIDWSDPTYSQDGSNVFHLLFHCPASRPGQEIPSTGSVRPSIWQGNLSDSCPRLEERYRDMGRKLEWRESSIDLRRLDYPEDVVVVWTFNDQVERMRSHLDASCEEFRGVPRHAILSSLLGNEMVLQQDMRSRVDRFRAAYFKGTMVGVHVRYTDHRANLWMILKQLDALLSREIGARIFLATDNAEIRRLFERTYGDVVTTEHWYPRPGHNAHRNWSCPDRTENAREALTDLYLLAECQYLIVDTSSSFSRVATLVSKAEPSNIWDARRGRKRGRRARRWLWAAWRTSGLYWWGLRLVQAARWCEGRLGRRRTAAPAAPGGVSSE